MVVKLYYPIKYIDILFSLIFMKTGIVFSALPKKLILIPGF
jgi:hypothetical protein